MKNLVRVSSFVFATLLFTNLFTSCKKDGTIDLAPEVTTNTPSSNSNLPTNAAKVMALQTKGAMTNDSTDYCECFAIFDEVNWEVSEDEIIAQLEVILVGLTEQEVEELFTPVCTFDGEFFENACVAICNGVTGFEICEDYNGDEDDWNECFSFVYPITIVLPDATNVEVNNDDELITAIDNWYDANPNNDEDPTLIFPVNVLLEADGSSLTINDQDELEDLFEICDEYHEDNCFTFHWPISLQFPDSSIVEINSFEEGGTVVDAWYDAHPNVEEEVKLVFPFDVTLEDGTVQTISNEDELDALIDECGGDMGGCFYVDNAPNALIQTTVRMKKTASGQ